MFRPTIVIVGIFVGIFIAGQPSHGLSAERTPRPPEHAKPPENAFVVSLAQDSAGRVWIGTEDLGVYRYDPTAPEPEQWTQFTTRDGLGDDNAYALCVDRRDRVWVGHLNHGVSVYNGESWKNYDVPDGPIGERVFSIAADPVSGDVWMGTSAGLTCYSLEKNAWTHFTRDDGLPSDQVQSLAFDARGTLYAGTQCEGLAISDAGDAHHQWRQISGSEALPLSPAGTGLPSNLINDVLVARGGTVFVATDGGLAASKDRGKSWTFVRGANWAAKVKGLDGGPPRDWTERSAPFLLTEDYCTCLAEDESGLLWIGHRETGYEAIDPVTLERKNGGEEGSGARGQGSGKQGSGARGQGSGKKALPDFVAALLAVRGHSPIVGWYGNGVAFDAAGDHSPLKTHAAAAALAPSRHPAPTTPPSLAELNALLAKLDEMPALRELAPTVVEIPDDWRTEGDWLGRHGRDWACLCAICSPDDYIWGAGAQPVLYDVRIGPHADNDDSQRYWIHWLATDLRSSLEMPPTYLDSRIIKGYNTAGKNRREAEWNDNGEVYPRSHEGPDLYVTLDIPDGQYYLSLYDHNKDGHDGPNRWRDYRLSLREYVGTDQIRETQFYSAKNFDRQPELAGGRIRDFWDGVWKRFYVQGPMKLTVKVARNGSHNAQLSGVMVDLIDERPAPYFQTPDEWIALRNGRDAVLTEPQAARAERFAARRDGPAAADRLFVELEAMRSWNPRWWAAESRPYYAALLRWFRSAESADMAAVKKLNPKLTTCYYRLGLYEPWEQRQRAEKLLPARDIEKALRWDEMTYSEQGREFEVVTKYLESRANPQPFALHLLEGPDENAKPVPLLAKRFTGGIPVYNFFREPIVRQSDGSSVCVAAAGIYLSTDDPRHWWQLSVPSPFITPVGGDRERLFFESANGNEGALASYDVASKQLKGLRNLPSHLASFVSKDIGAISTGENINWTLDGCATWNATPPFSKKEGIAVASIQWLDASRLLVGLSDGSLQLLKRDGANLLTVWTKARKKPFEILGRVVPDGDDAWTRTLGRLHLADGQLDAPLATDFTPEVIAACHGHLVVGGMKLDQKIAPHSPRRRRLGDDENGASYVLADWLFKPGTGYERDATLPIGSPVVAILPLKAPKCLMINAAGKGFAFDVDTRTLVAAPLRVTSLPVAKKADQPTEKEMHEYMDLVEKVPADRLEAILDEADKRDDAKGENRTEWMMQQFRQAIAEDKKGKQAPTKGEPPAKGESPKGEQPPKQDSQKQAQSAPTNPKAGAATTIGNPAGDKSRFEPVVQAAQSSQFQSATFSQDSRYLLTTGGNTVFLWDTATAHLLRTFYVDGYGVSIAVAFSPDGKQLFVGSEDGSAILYETVSGRRLHELKPKGSDGISSAAFSLDGKRICIAAGSDELEIWDTSTAGLLRSIKQQPRPTRVRSVVFSPDGKQVLSAQEDGTVMWNAATGEKVRSFGPDGEEAASAAFSPDGQQVLACSRDEAVLWETATGKELRTFDEPERDLTAAAFSAGGKEVFTSSEKSARFWDAARGQKLRTFVGLHAIAVSPDSKLVYGGRVNVASPLLWDPNTGHDVRPFPHDRGRATLICSPDGKHVLAHFDSLETEADGRTLLWEVATGRQLQAKNDPVMAGSTHLFSPDGQLILAAGGYKPLALWSAVTGERVRTFSEQSRDLMLAFGLDGKQAFTSGDDYYGISVWDVAGGRKIRKIPSGSKPPAFRPGGVYLPALEGPAEAILTSPVFGEKGPKLGPNAAGITSVAFFANGKRALIGLEDGLVITWDIAAGKKIDTLAASQRSSVEEVLVSPDGKLGLSRTHSGPAHLFDLAAAKIIHTWSWHPNFVSALAFSSDSKLVLTGDDDGTMESRDAATGVSIRKFEGHKALIDKVAFTYDAKIATSRSWDGPAIFWDAASGKELAQLVSLNDGKDWLAVTTAGLYDGSESGRGSLAFRIGGGLKIEPAQSYPELRRDGLLMSLLRGERPVPEKPAAPAH